MKIPIKKQQQKTSQAQIYRFDIISINQSIAENIVALGKMRDSLRIRAEDKANAAGEYEKAIALTIIQLKNGIPFDFEGEIIEKPPATITEKIAKGICYRQSIQKDLTESYYKNTVLSLQTIQTIINAFQSILKYSDEV